MPALCVRSNRGYYGPSGIAPCTSAHPFCNWLLVIARQSLDRGFDHCSFILVWRGLAVAPVNTYVGAVQQSAYTTCPVSSPCACF